MTRYAVIWVFPRKVSRITGKAGVAGEMPGYATHMDKVTAMSKYLHAGGYIGIGVGGASSALKIKEVCAAGRNETCKRIIITEVSSFGVGLGGGAAGGKLSNMVAAQTVHQCFTAAHCCL
ncbi:hypothetical protein ACLUUI_10145 [Enterobacterales bacterium AW_CKDN230030176-1A_HGKHYDSX7]